MFDNGLCPWGEQWRNGRLIRPKQKGKKYFADVTITVLSENLCPSDYDYRVKQKGFYDVFKEVEISKEKYLQITK